MADTSALEQALRDRAREIVDRAADSVERAIKDAAPVGETGDLRDDIEVTPYEAGNIYGARASSPTSYAGYVDKGTPPHTILPRNASVLRFEIGGEVVFARKVDHPGTARTGFFTDTVQRWPEFLAGAQ